MIRHDLGSRISTDIDKIYRLPDLTKPIYVAQGLSYIPPYLTSGYAARKGTAKDLLTELLFADLGDAIHQSPYLMVSTPIRN